MTEGANFYYKVIPFGLKNVGATCQRLMDKVFVDLIGSTMKFYVDDMVIKSTSMENHPLDIEKVFNQI